MSKEINRKECWYVVWKYEFRTGVFMTLTSLARALKDDGIGYWTLYRVLRQEGNKYYDAGGGIEIHASFIYK